MGLSVIITGTHPEYFTEKMLAAIEKHMGSGGKSIYLGGNKFYWVTSVDPERPYLIEVRRGLAGTRAWGSAPGEYYHSTTGELGGLWRHRGKPPNKLVGIGFTAMGWDTNTYGYVRKPRSFDERVKFIFEGIGENEVIGNFGLVMNSAVGDELDRLDYELGTPPQTLLLASSEGHSSYYSPVIEDITQITPSLRKGECPNVRARGIRRQAWETATVLLLNVYPCQEQSCER